MISWWWSWLLMTVGIIGLWLAGSRRWYGWTICLAGQVLWIAYGIATSQPGFVASALVYGYVYARNWRRWVVGTRRPRGSRKTSGAQGG